MKKTQFALAAMALLAAAGAAQAQSSVTIYGIAEGSIASVNDGTTAIGSAADQVSVNGLNSRFGFRGTEDLGSGLKAKFQLEQRFGLDTGNAANTSKAFFGRSVVGLEGAFGEVAFGRDYLPVYQVAGASDPFGFDGTIANLGYMTFAGYQLGGSNTIRMDNSVTYILPTMAQGLSVTLGAAAGEGLVNSNAGFNAIYKTGELQVGLGYDRQTAEQNLTVAMASYDFGMVKPIVSYSHAEVMGLENKNVSIGATAPLMGGTLKAAYAVYNPDGADNSTDKFSLGFEYGLSKRTSVFTNLATAKTDSLTRTNGLDAGLRHRF